MADQLGTTTTQQIPNAGNQNPSSESSNGDKIRSAMFVDLEALDCPICTDALIGSILQCENGHVACSSCCEKMSYKCPSCTLPVGFIRNRVLERIIKGVIVQCKNVKLGCTKSFLYGEELTTHEKDCVFALCSCPVKKCGYEGSYKDLFSHFAVHLSEGMVIKDDDDDGEEEDDDKTSDEVELRRSNRPRRIPQRYLD